MADKKKVITRRSFVGGTAGGLGLLSLGFPVKSLAQPEISRIKITQAVTALAFVQSYIAQELGFFRDEGLEVELVVTRGGGPDVQAVVAGDAAFTVNDGAQVLPALARGLELKCLLATLDRNIINVSMLKDTAEGLGVDGGSPIDEKLQALEGLRIGVTRPGALTWQLARFGLSRAGLNPDRDARIVGLGGGPAVAAGLENGDVEAIYLAIPLGERVVLANKAITLIDNAVGEDPYIPSFMMEGLWARPDFIENNPRTCSATVRALKRASRFVLQNSVADVAAPLQPVFGALGSEVLRVGVEKVKSAISEDGRFTQGILDNTQNVLKANEAVDRSFSIEEIFDGRFLA